MSQHLAQTELYTGKAKSVYATNDPENLFMLFRNDTSAFDGVKKMALENKGMVNNYFNAHIMQYLDQHGIATHFVKILSPQESLVKKLTMLPIECVVRNFAAGSLCRRLGVQEGRELNPPTFEFFLKNDALHDPMINEAHIISLGWATEQQITEMKRLSLEVNRLLVKLFHEHGLLLADFKLEFGLFNGQLLLGDEITPDGCRIWDAETKKILDKDRFRKDLGSVVESYIEAATRLGVKLPD